MMEQQLLTSPDEHIASLKPPVVWFLGPEDSFSHLMAMRLFGANGEPTGRRGSLPDFNSIAPLSEVINNLRANPEAVGVLPLESTTNTPIKEVADELLTGEFRVLAEAWMKIDLFLACNKVGNISSIVRVHSHAQPLRQAKRLIEQYGFETEVEVSTSVAAAKMQTSGMHDAALCSQRAAKDYKLKILEPHFQDDPDNRTKFLVVQHQKGSLASKPGLLGEKQKDPSTVKAMVIVTPKRLASDGLFGFISSMHEQGIGYKHIDTANSNLEEPNASGSSDYGPLDFSNLDYLYELFGPPRVLNEALRQASDAEFRLLGAYPVGSLYSE